MSVTFSAENAPTILVENEWYDPFYPETLYDNPKMVYQSVWAEMNVSNMNSRVILGMLGLDSEDLCGSVECKNLHGLLRKIVKIKNTTRISKMTRSTDVQENMIVCGVTEERAYQYLDRLQDVIMVCLENQRDLCWC